MGGKLCRVAASQETVGCRCVRVSGAPPPPLPSSFILVTQATGWGTGPFSAFAKRCSLISTLSDPFASSSFRTHHPSGPRWSRLGVRHEVAPGREHPGAARAQGPARRGRGGRVPPPSAALEVPGESSARTGGGRGSSQGTLFSPLRCGDPSGPGPARSAVPGICPGMNQTGRALSCFLACGGIPAAPRPHPVRFYIIF
jgi:hypothetical protein